MDLTALTWLQWTHWERTVQSWASELFPVRHTPKTHGVNCSTIHTICKPVQGLHCKITDIMCLFIKKQNSWRKKSVDKYLLNWFLLPHQLLKKFLLITNQSLIQCLTHSLHVLMLLEKNEAESGKTEKGRIHDRRQSTQSYILIWFRL